MKDLNKIKEFFSKSLKEMEFGDPLEQIFMNYAGKTIEMEFDDPNSDWSNLIGDLEEYFPGDKLSDFMSSKELEIYLDDYNIRLIDPIMDREVDPSIVKRGKAKMDIDTMRKAANLPPLDDPISMNEAVLVMDDTITPDMWDREKIKVGIESKRITNPFWFTKPHKIIDFNSILGMISFDHPAKQKLSLNWVNSFLKDNHKVDMSAEPEGSLSTKFAKSPSAKLKMNEGEEDVKASFEKIMDLLRKESRKLSDEGSYALGLKLRDWFEKNILKENKPVANINKHIKAIQIQLDDLGVKYEMSDNPYKPFKAVYKPVNKDDEWYDMFDDIVFRYNLGGVVKTTMDEATKEEETEFHKKLDKLVHDTFGKRKDELEEVNLKQSKLSSAEYQKAKKLKDFKASDWKWNADEDLYTKVNEGEMEENMLSLDDQAKAYYLEKLKKGEIDKLPDNPKAAFLAQMTKDEIKKDRQQFRSEQGLEEIKQRIFNKLKK